MCFKYFYIHCLMYILYIDDHNTTYVFASKGIHVVYMNLEILIVSVCLPYSNNALE